MEHYRNQGCKELQKLLKDDEITYNVLFRIVSDTCSDIFTDRKDFIVCYSCPPFPVWTWCKNIDKAPYIARCIEENFPFEQGHYHIMSPELFDELKYLDYFKDAYAAVDMLSYKLSALKPLSKECDGFISQAACGDLEKLSKLFHDFGLEAEGIDFDMAHCRKHISAHIADGSLFTWRNAKGEITAMARLINSEAFSAVSSVYTLPEHRRKGYAENLVHRLCKNALDNSLIPILYADASYGPSNDCYKKVGFEQIGRVLHIRKRL